MGMRGMKARSDPPVLDRTRELTGELPLFKIALKQGKTVLAKDPNPAGDAQPGSGGGVAREGEGGGDK